MDALSDVLRFVGLTGGVFLDAEFSAPWWVWGQIGPETCRPFMPPPDRVVGFHYVVEGGFELRLEGGGSTFISAGQVVMLPHNSVHMFGSSPGSQAVQVRELVAQQVQDGARRDSVTRLVHGGGGERTRMICGFLGGDAELQPILANLPTFMTIDLGTLPGGDWMGRTFAHAAQTLAENDPGAATVLAKMAELLFVESIRRYLASLPTDQTGWLAGLRDRAIAQALSLMHSRLQEDWTTDSLAKAVNLSRSAFAERFSALIGAPPMRYLLNWRIQVAKQKLRDSRESIAQIAFAVGYESEASFTRAFRRETGQPPAAWRKQAVAG